MISQIRAVCFDADGVVVNPQMQFARLLAGQYGISREMTCGFFTGVFNDCLVGKADLARVLPPYLSAWGWPGSVSGFIDTWMETDAVVDAQLVELIQHLRRMGLLCCLATNQEKNRAGYMKTVMGLTGWFDHLFFSCEIGSQKPDPAFYRHIQRVLGLESQAILFWDDAARNVEAARELGWNAEVYTLLGDCAWKTRDYLNRPKV